MTIYSIRVRLRRLRHERGWSQEALALRMTQQGYRLTKSMVSRHEGGSRTINQSVSVAYAQVFNVVEI